MSDVQFQVADFDNSSGTVEYYSARMDFADDFYYSDAYAVTVSKQCVKMSEWCEQVFGTADPWGFEDLSSGWKHMYMTWYFCRAEDRMAFLMRWDNTQFLPVDT